jgi:phosphoribosylamine---glycine ligase
MRILVVGNGAREHALCRTLPQSPELSALHCAPGNPGIQAHAISLPIPIDQLDQIVQAAVDHRIDLVVVGPEAPLAAGLVDRLRDRGISAFGPTAAAARIESSKAWTKELLRRIGVPTASAAIVTSESEAWRQLERFGFPVVLKADGLAAGKGVTVARNQDDAEVAIHDLLVRRSLGAASDTVVIEEFLEGRELSVLAFCDGEALAMMPPARDYKAAFDGDRGPNTGGMGAYSRPAFATPELLGIIERDVLRPVVRALARMGSPFVGVLYAGLMLTRDGPRVLEFNCRFGDPETQVILPLLETDLATILDAIVRGRLAEHEICWHPGSACGVVLASGGYPAAHPTGLSISGLDEVPTDAIVLQAGTAAAPDGSIVTAGGRVLTVVGRGETPAEARARAYDAVGAIRFEGRHFRTDIAADDGPLPFDPTVNRQPREASA